MTDDNWHERALALNTQNLCLAVHIYNLLHTLIWFVSLTVNKSMKLNLDPPAEIGGKR